jgi:hypothetical protein
VREVWAETSPGLRGASLLMWAAAAAGTAAGVIGDQNGWWDTHAFLTNLASSLVAALFGVPLALIVIRRISASESNRLDRAAAVQFARLTMGRLTEDLTRLLPQPAEAGALSYRLRDLDARVQALPEQRFGPDLTRVLTEWTELAGAVPPGIGPGPDAADAVRDAEATWHFLCRHVTPRLQIYEVEWLSRSVIDRMEVLFEQAERFTRGRVREIDRLTETAQATIIRLGTDPDCDRHHDEYTDVRISVEEQVELLLGGVDSLVELHDTVVALTAALDVTGNFRYTNT